MELRAAVIAACGIVAGTTGAEAAKRGIESWSKPGVSLDTYRADSADCAKRGFYRDVAQDEPAKRFIRGFTTSDVDLNTDMASDERILKWRDVIRRTNPDRRKQELHAIQVGDVEKCLTVRGYNKFTLNRSEAKALAQYPVGSAARQRYLHGLATMQRDVAD